jgi:uncharacterized protein (TIGR02118 family)
MTSAKFIELYPCPKDIAAFEKTYQEEHVPMVIEKLAGKTKIVMTKVFGFLKGTPKFYRVAEIHFPSMEDLSKRTMSEGGKETMAHSTSISTGGEPIFLIAQEGETLTFEKTGRVAA